MDSLVSPAVALTLEIGAAAGLAAYIGWLLLSLFRLDSSPKLETAVASPSAPLLRKRWPPLPPPSPPESPPAPLSSPLTPALRSPELHQHHIVDLSPAGAQFPSNEGHWSCNTSPKVWHDEHQQPRATSAAIDAARVAEVLRGRWVVLVGDSSVRMLYHMLVGIVAGGWTRWPIGGSARLDESSCLYTVGPGAAGGDPCVEDSWVRGFRATCVWSDFGDVASLASLASLSNATVGVPDLVLVGVGAWWAWHRAHERDAYSETVHQLLRRLDTMFVRRHAAALLSGATGARNDAAQQMPPPAPLKVFASTTSCARDGDSAAFAVYKFNSLARDAVHAIKGWVYLNRDVVAGDPCEPETDCLGSHYSARFHPSGDALNVLVNLLVARLARWGSRDRTAGQPLA